MNDAEPGWRIRQSSVPPAADEGSSRKRRNREHEEAPLGATLNDHVSNGDRERPPPVADEGSPRKRRNREFEEAPLGATLNDHVSNGKAPL